MAPAQDFARALRERFGPEETIITLAEVLSFLETHQKQPTRVEKQKQQQGQHGAPQNASPREKGSHDRQRNAPRPTPRSQDQARDAPRSTEEVTWQAGPPTQQRPMEGQLAQQQPIEGHTDQTNTSTERQQGQKLPSYADIARKASKKPIEKPLQKANSKRKAPTLPESVKLAPKAPRPIKINLREPTIKTPKELIGLIKERAVNGERLATSIKAFRALSPKYLLVYPTTEAAKEELEQNTSWLDAIHASIYTRNYSIVIYRVRRDISIEEISKRIREQNPILQEDLASSTWLGKERGPLGTLRIDIKDPIIANRAILKGIALDYEFKKVYQYIPRKKPSIKQRERLFYKEKTPKLPIVVFTATKEANKPPT